jgi:hypothetical protein
VTVTTTAPVVITSTTSTITTITSVLPAAASTTSTFSTTSTISTTETSTYSTTTTVTLTATEIAPTPTASGMCQANNIASSYNRFAIESIYTPGGLLSSASANSPYDCCVLCATTPGCAATIFYSNECDLINAVGSCDGSLVSSTFQTYQHDPNPDGFVISNGPCGQYAYQST